MNIFVLDYDGYKNAEYHCDKHVVKMITEQTQLLCSAYYFTDFIPEGVYKLTHANHPCAKWARESLSNWLWLCENTLILCEEYTYRYGKHHKCERLCETLPNPKIEDIGLTPFALAMPEQYKCEDAVESYRNYYNGEKQHLFHWKNRPIPDWIEN